MPFPAVAARGLGPIAVRVCLAASLVFGVGCSRLVDGLRSHAPPAGTESAARIEAGPYAVESIDFEWVDDTRPMMENGDFPGASARDIGVTVRYPTDAAGPRPLIVYSHGFTGNRTEMAYLLEHLASHGNVVAALDFPLTTTEAPGGPTALDLASQPGDVRFVIDRVLAENAPGGALAGRIDEERIGAAGLSYGALTTTLVAFHPTEGDPRVKAALSIAGPTQMFTERFFAADDTPFGMLAGTQDLLVPYDLNATPLVAKAGAEVVLLDAGTHLGFVEFAGTWMRFSFNPDETACNQFADATETPENPFEDDPFDALGGEEIGMDFSAWVLPCQGGAEVTLAMRPARQQILSALAARAFFDAQFADDGSAREAASAFLARGMPAELADASYSGP